MSLTQQSYRMGVIPPWCQVFVPSGGMLESRRTYYEVIDWIPEIVGNPGNKVKISFLVCAVDIFAYYVEEWDTWYRDAVDFSINLSRIGDEQDRVYLNARVAGHTECLGFHEDEIFYPDICNYYLLIGLFKDLKWKYVEFEKVIPEPWTNLNQWRVQIMLNQVQEYQGPSNSVFWFDDFKVYHNDTIIWEKKFDPPPGEDPPPIQEGYQIIKANNSPWERWEKPAPECTGDE